MAGIKRYYCQTCNTDLGVDGNLVDVHLAANLTHVVSELVHDSSETIATVQGITRVYDNELYSWDESRQKWLSVNRIAGAWAVPSNNINNVYLRLWGSMVPSNADMGFGITSPAVITKIRANRRTANSSTTFSVLIYGGATFTTFVLEAGVYEDYDLTYNINVSAGDTLSVYMSGSSSSSQPQCWIEFARRI
jgi:hypothetical protein